MTASLPKIPVVPPTKKMGLGRIAYHLWYRPRSALARCRLEGGPWQQWLTHQGERQMAAAARRLPPLPGARESDPEICFLTGLKYWHQTAFCAWSLHRASKRSFRFVFHDDGTLTSSLNAEARRIFPGCEIVSDAEARVRLDRYLPTERFPSLRNHRLSYPHLRKLTDFHAGHTGWRIVMDSDMLFFRPPEALVAWLDAPALPLHATDIHDSYGYPIEVLNNLGAGPVTSLINVGLLGLSSHELDWDRIEQWCSRLLSEHGSSYYLEQGLAALILASQPTVRLPLNDYLLMPDEGECRRPTAIMHHYVGLPKHGYFRFAWRNMWPQSS